MFIWTYSFCHPQELQAKPILICILLSLLPAAAVNPHHLRVCTYWIMRIWSTGNLLNFYVIWIWRGEKEFSHTHQVEYPVHIIHFLHYSKENKIKPYRGFSGDVWLAFSLHPIDMDSTWQITEKGMLATWFLIPLAFEPFISAFLSNNVLSLHLSHGIPEAESS